VQQEFDLCQFSTAERPNKFMFPSTEYQLFSYDKKNMFKEGELHRKDIRMHEVGKKYL
jgi:hypothetical protein